ncbi:hypothetical protein BT63DRAFT_419643 [Microthyrium microscopicum]|uniref:Uncharacterized protein n=1 Tax=Microthyrium microscopicum TaxID=703497 RepID=A0A6A6UTG2_9PEZI|nr:hypothetical protein BT63DRAFT_419643 [Microthyrium microscopicum]
MAMPSSLLSTMLSGTQTSTLAPSSTMSIANLTSATPSLLLSPVITSLPDLNDGDDGGDGTENKSDQQQGIIYQYFFLILILLVIAILVLLFVLRRRNQRRKSLQASLGRHALARDLESWQPGQQTGRSAAPPSTARRWVQRYNNRFGTRLGRTSEEDEGLNEYGEAPPPYKAQEAALESRPPTNTTMTSTLNEPAVPLRTLSRNVADRLPGYQETTTPPLSETPPTMREESGQPSQSESGQTNSAQSGSTQPALSSVTMSQQPRPA